MKALRDRELLGSAAARRTAGLIVGRHLLNFLRPSRRLELRGSRHQRGPVLCLDIESSGRFLLTGALDCSISLWDLERKDTDAERASAAATAALQAGQAPPAHSSRRPLHWDREEGWVQDTSTVGPTKVMRRGRYSEDGLHPHTFAVSAVQWYPVDPGVFVSGGQDGKVKVWDAQHCCVVAGINCGGNVHTLRMPSASTVGAAHCLVAVGSSSEDVALVDLRACSAAHRLQGHRPCSSYSSSHSSSSSSSTGGGDESGGVLSVDWSPRSEWVLASGGADGGVRLWDVRKSGAAACLACLDQYNVQGDDEDEDLDDSCSDWGKSRRNRRGGDIGGGRRGHGYGYSSNSSTEAHSNACAHGSAVVGLRFAPSGRHLVSLGTTGGASSGDDGGRPMKVWSVDNARVLPMHFSGVASQVGTSNVGIAVSEPSRHAMHPYGDSGGPGLLIALPQSPRPDITLYDCRPATSSGGGQPSQTLRGHLEPASALCFRPSGGATARSSTTLGQLVSVGADGLCLCWERDEKAAAEHRAKTRKRRRPVTSVAAASASTAQVPASARSSRAQASGITAHAGVDAAPMEGGFLPTYHIASAQDGDTWSNEEEDEEGAGTRTTSRAELSTASRPRAYQRSRIRRNHNSHA